MTKILAGILATVLWISAPINAKAHSFSVALLIPLAGQSKADGKAVLDGFLLATKERDGHPDEESDGHLGGLDVYVNTTDNQDAGFARLKSIMKQKPIDIIVSTGAARQIDDTLATIAGNAGAIVLPPGQLPYPVAKQIAAPQFTAFAAAFKAQYGYEHSQLSASGYNAARRIDQAVRALGGVDDKAALNNLLKQTAINFSW